jgi:hypothetical protein
MGDEKKGFTVKDRRHFTSEGEVRGLEPEESSVPDVSPGLPGPAPSPESNQAASPTPTDPGSEDPAGPISFGSFLMSLGGQAGALLDSDDPADVAAARQIISILEMLQEKTRGRLSAEEQRLHERLLYELRMAYVERDRTAKA